MPRNIVFPSGEKMPWMLYKSVMEGRVSPMAATEQMRRSPQGAYDSALPRRRGRRIDAWDQGEPRGEPGKLDGAYCRATDAYLRAHDIDPTDVDTINAILAKYMGDGDEATPTGAIPTGLPRGIVNQTGPMGHQDSARRHAQDATYYDSPWAFDSRGGRLSAEPPMTKDFVRRNPGAARIRILG
jgi:hypothetical protein